MVTTVLFDLDGLLIDSEIVYFHVVEGLIETYGEGKRITLSDYVRENSGRTIEDNAKAYVNKYGLSMTWEEAMDYIQKKEGEYRENPGIPLKKGAAGLLKYLKENGYHILLASSSPKERAVSALEKNQVLSFFDDLTCAEDVTHGKPDPEIFLTAAKKAKAEPSACLVLEDSENGILAAHSAKMKVICVPDLKQPDPKYRGMADAAVESLADVPPLLRQM